MTFPIFPTLTAARRHLAETGWAAISDDTYLHGGTLVQIGPCVGGFEIRASRGHELPADQDNQATLMEGLRRRILIERTG